ncbi:recombinase family protein [Paenibacillus alba]|uniref:recombinase family protein n=1 Tax=Paenibacillus alba TaxID=1197127 RepID=UPI0015649356|nr:recombinase family protein [Paenibacillus alba]NQX67944.1 recombinase family protein [Paenibacillus alba]
MFKLPEGRYCGYLRKSRADIEAESRGEGDTYKRHEKILFDLATRYNINLSKIYREKPISGERITERPEVISLLEDVENERWTGVLVVEVERLARGDTMDQGIVAQAFKFSETLIVTPMRIYNPLNRDDEEYFEFGLFMSRREFKTINRRQQDGRLGGVDEGRYVANIAPYGYTRVKLPGKGFTLEKHPAQAPIVELVFRLYTDPDPTKRMGTALIAAYLNEKQIPSAKGKKWIVATINSMLRNIHYIGYVKWGQRALKKKRDSKSRPRKSLADFFHKKGLHPAIIGEDTFYKAQEILYGSPQRSAPSKKLSNPLAGIIRCGMCGGAMQRKPYRGRNNQTPPSLICSTQYCKNVGSYFDIVEKKIILGLKQWLAEYKSRWLETRPEDLEKDNIKLRVNQDTLRRLGTKLSELTEQKKEVYTLLEKKVYTHEMFFERMNDITREMTEINNVIEKVKEEITLEENQATAVKETIPKIEHVLQSYFLEEDPEVQNAMIRSILSKVIYTKEKGGRWSGLENQFEIEIHPRKY